VGTNPRSVVAGDFNGDGKTDLAVANYGSNDVSILLSNGDGTFQTVVNYEVGANPDSIAVGDFNGDGKIDLVTANYNTDDVSILLGNGNGTFQEVVDYDAGSYPVSVAVGDFNRDGKPDLAVANSGSGDVSILLGKGDGTFQTAVSYGILSPQSLAAADFNGDGKLDLAISNNSNLWILLGNGDGTFQQLGAFLFCGSAIAVGDFNGDGKPDLAGECDGVVVIELGRGDGRFQSAGGYSVAAGAHSLAVGDFNGDGKVDLASTNYDSNSVSIMLGNGDGTLRAAVDYGVGSFPQSVAVGDFIGGGKKDLAVANGGYSNVSILLGKGDGTFQTAVSYGVDSNPQSVALGDFNGDGRPDLAVANYSSNNVSILLGNADGSFKAANPTRYAAGSSPRSVAVGDFNRDGKPDLAVANHYSGGVSILLGNGDGSFKAAASYGAGYNPVIVAVGDFNGDGKQDLAVANGDSNTVSILLGNGNGSFQAATSIEASYNPIFIAVGDFNGDGKQDLVIANGDSNTVSILLGNGNGTFQTDVSYRISSYSNPGPHSAAVGDFNGDSKTDIAVVNSSSGEISILLGKDNGSFQPSVNYRAGSYPVSVAVGDFNRDGKPDLAVANSGSGTVSVLFGNGNGTFQTAVSYGVSSYSNPGPYSVAAADFNGDGKPDMAVANYISNSVSILLNALTCTPLTWLSPSSAIAGGAALGLTVNGSNFVSGSIVNWNGSARSTTFVSSTQLIAAIPDSDIASAGTAQVTVTNPDGSTSAPLTFTIKTCPTITLTPATLPNGTVGSPYNQTISASGGTSPYQYVISAEALPPGLSLSAAGVLSGIPSASGPFSFTVKATDADGCTGSQTYSLTICSAITLTPSSLPNGFVGVAYSQTFTASGGTSPYSHTVSEGSLPPGLTLSSSGSLSGTPTLAGAYKFTIRATDSKLCTGDQPYSLLVSQPVCSYSIASSSQLVSSTGGNGSVKVTTGAGCNWTASSSIDWVTISAGSNGSGSGLVFYSVAENTGGIRRQGTITIAGQPFSLDQLGTPVVPPAAATPIYPSGSTTANSSFIWTAVPAASGYNLLVNDSQTPTGKIKISFTAADANCAAGIGNCSVSPQVPLSQGQGEWWVQTWNSAGSGPWSDRMSFTIASDQRPEDAKLISPDGTISTRTPTYTWYAVPKATWYQVLVNDSTGSPKLLAWYSAEQAGCAAGVGICSATPTTALANGQGGWWIQTWNSAGYGPWSGGLSFTVAAASNP